MGRAPCCDKANVKKGPWSPEEDSKLKDYIEKYGTGGNWIALPQKAGLKRCGKSCRLRWLNYLRPNIKHGEFTDDEDRIICTLFATIGSRWSIIAAQLPGRTDNDIKNYWNTKLKKKLMAMTGTTTTTSCQVQPRRKPTPPFSSSVHQAPPVSSLLYRDYTPIWTSLTPFEPMSSSQFVPFNNEYNTMLANNYSLIQTPESLMSSDTQMMQSFLMFNGTEPSCTSSDGSTYGREQMKQEDMSFQGFGGYDDDQRFMLNYGSCCNDNGGDQSGWYGDEWPLLGYNVEEIKRLISGSGGNNWWDNSSSSSSSFIDENNHHTQQEEKVMYYN